ncbi:alpha/beta hydrolase [Dokdonella sp.]|uniref:alpha/beta hydrolase n=1 Tax=Dokdonella sp. TaxID=2291710 RepID=UPI0035272D38
MVRTSKKTLPAVLCIHGAGAGGWEWNQWRRVMSAHGLVASAPDLQPAANGLAQTRFEDYRAQVVAWVQPLVRRQQTGVVLAGASLGGLLALAVAADVEAAAVILVNPMPPAGVVANPLGKPHPAILHWGQQRSISSTRRAMHDADDAACLYAFRRWRDESGLVLEQARLGIPVAFPRCPVLVIASQNDDDVPVVVSRGLATRCSGDFELLPDCSHVGPLLGTDAPSVAERAVDWLMARLA